MAPTMVTSSPSRIHTVPSPMTTSQWNFDHGRRSSRAGMVVWIVFSDAAPFVEEEVCALTWPTVGGLCVSRQSLDKPAAVRIDQRLAHLMRNCQPLVGGRGALLIVANDFRPRT